MSAARWPLAPLPWQQETWSALTRAALGGRMPHALMLTGTPGIGKAWCLKALAALLLCEDVKSGTACGECRNCGLLLAGSHGDYLEVGPEEKSRVIKVDQVRALIDYAGRTPSFGERKVILLGPAEVMNINAANSLLKCLEEPSPSTVLLLYSHQPSGLPATVRSRCQQLSMGAPSDADTLQWLTLLAGSEEAAAELAAVCPGQPLHAAELYHGEGLATRVALHRGLEALCSGRLSPLEFPSLVGELELGEVLGRMQAGLEEGIRTAMLGGQRVRSDAFSLRDDLALMQRRILHGANPNRQLIIEDCATRFADAMCDFKA